MASSTSRAFAQKLPKAAANDIRRQTAAGLKNTENTSSNVNKKIGHSSITSSLPLSGHSADDSFVEPLDYEEYVTQPKIGGDPLARDLMEFPSDDIEVSLLSRKIRTLGHVVPDEPLNKLDPTVQTAVDCYTSDWVVVKRRYQHFSSSVIVRDFQEERANCVRDTRRQEFEVDETPDNSEDEVDNHLLNHRRSWFNTNMRRLSVPNSLGGSARHSMISLDRLETQSLSGFSQRRNSVYSQLDIFVNDEYLTNFINNDDDDDDDDEEGGKTPTNRSPTNVAMFQNLLDEMSIPSVLREKLDRESGSDTPTRGSWASFDLRNSTPDPPIPGLLDSTPDRLVDTQKNSGRRRDFFTLYHPQSEDEIVERRLPAEAPSENLKHRILVQCNKLELNLQFEPIFASMALYDVKEKKKVSENFYFDMNSEQMKSMLIGYVNKVDYTTQARSCIFDISSNSNDLFLVVKLEKVLQGDINEAAEPYLKEQALEKVKVNAAEACFKLGKYRMPFAWTAIWVQNIVKGKDFDKSNDSGGSDAETNSASNSLDRKASATYDQYRRGRPTESTGSLNRRGSLERQAASNNNYKRSSWSSGGPGIHVLSEDASSNSLDSFPPVTLTVSSFFKQEGDKLKDEDLYKFLQDLKRPSPNLKRLKCIRGTLKLDISVAPEHHKCCLTPELTKIIPYPDTKTRPTKEILEFPPREVLLPNYQYRNLLYICPKDLNFTNRSGERARNIAIKVQFMAGEDENSSPLKVIYGKSSCPEFTTERFTPVTYHNKCPDFYEEIKINLPPNLRDYHHILFTFYHVSCQGQRKEQESIEVPVGYTWIPIYQNGSLQTGLFDLPVMIDPPPPRYSYISTEFAPPGSKWVDNKKPIFSVEVIAATTVHAVDQYLDPFCTLTASLQLGPDSQSPTKFLKGITEDDLINRIKSLSSSRLTPLVRFLPLILDKLLLLMVKPPLIGGGQHAYNIGQVAFNAIASVVQKISSATELQSQNDRHGRNSLLTTYIHYQAHLPHPDFRNRPSNFRVGRKSHASQGDMMANDHDEDKMAPPPPNASLRNVNDLHNAAAARFVHEQLALQLSTATGRHLELALSCGWFFLELTIKAMIEHLATTSRMEVPRKNRFSEQFHDDVMNLVASITGDIISRQQNNPNMAERLNSCLAFFLHDLLSVMDRGFVFSLIKMYMKDTTNVRNSNNSDSINLWNLQLDFIRIICCHEHYVTLNLPSRDPLIMSRSSSPSPSVRSNDSQNSFITFGSSSSSSGKDSPWTELSSEFKRQHFLAGLVLTQLSNALDQMSSEIHYRAVNVVRNLLSCHDLDSRYSEPEYRARVASLYLPLVGIMIENCHKLFAWISVGDSRIVGNTQGQNPNLNLILNVISDNLPHPKGPLILKEETTRHLLICFLWVIKNVENNTLKTWWSELSTSKIQILLELLRITISCFQYKRGKLSYQRGFLSDLSESSLWFKKRNSKNNELSLLSPTDSSCSDKDFASLLEIKGKKIIRKNASLGMRKNSDNVRSRLEDMIMGQGTARQDMMQRSRKDRLPPSPNPDGNRRWNKTSFLRNTLTPNDAFTSSMCASGTTVTGNMLLPDPETDAHIDGNLATEAGMLVLDALEIIVQVVAQMDQSHGLLANVLRVLLHALGTNQSTLLLQRLFAVQRNFVFKFPSLLFDEASEHCADLCLRLLKHCSSSIPAVRSQASASLYLLMRQNFEIGNNFARVKMQVTMSLSQLVGTMSNFNEDFLRKSLKTILVYAEQDQELSDTSFPEQVQDLVFNLHMILSDTVKMKEYQDDPEMHMDLMYRIAKGYQNSPDLRLTWLESMAKKHEEQNHYAEAGMCKIHCAALVSEYLHMLEDRKYMPTGAVTFSKLSPNALEESAVSDDVVSPDEEGICTGSKFTEAGLMTMLDEAAKYLSQSGMYEIVNEVYKVGLPIAEFNRNFKKLAEIHQELHEAFKNIDRLQGKRIFGTYFRVGFYGSRLFGDLDQEEFIYKEKALAKLPEIAQRLENFYGEKFGHDNLIIIKDSKNVETTKLNPDKAYIQITYVEPYFDSYELRDRITIFEKNFNISRFVFATPFTPDGNPHGELHEQFKRKTILTVANHFPYVKTRIQVVDRKQIVLTPIEVAIEDIQKKTQELEAAVNQDPPDPKILQMVLQGCIGTTVNQGPMEVANVFLRDLFDPLNSKTPTKHQNKLRLCFKDFSKKCHDAIEKNKKLITYEQKEYQKELQKNYATFERHLSPLFRLGPNLSQSQEDESKVTSPMV